MKRAGWITLVLAALTASADAEDAAKIAGHDISVVSDGMGMATLMGKRCVNPVGLLD